ncbi:MAG: type I DNA topoisomerase [Ruminococcaceae bacterium]|nr:type I DNA topoisomerase [Oscillospiraceae bacterium]
MAHNLVILESPSKATTVKGYLGTNYKVIASFGHVRDLPKSTLGVDIENDFDAHYINIRGKGDLIKEIRKEAKAANKIYLATDPDREGEAIAWHLAVALGIPVEKTQRICFNEVTKTAVKAAIKAPRRIDMNLVNSQQTRRILDRILGYKLSPLLWKNVKSGLSAGRVQSVATRIIVEREEKIRNFVPEEYWSIDTMLQTEEGKRFVVHFFGDENGKLRLNNESEAMAVANAVNGQKYAVHTVKKAPRHKTPAAPFTTSTLQQEAFRKLGFQSQRTMKVAQELYEGINLGSEFGGVQGLITYMRTDSVRISADAQEAARGYIQEKYGEEYCPETPRVYKSKAGAQDAHEAIRPARVELEPRMIRKNLTSDQFKLYKLIWECFIASQMESAVLDTITIDFLCQGYVFRTSGYTVKFPGYMALYEQSEEESRNNADDPTEVKDISLPELSQGQLLDADDANLTQHFTEPPVRFNDASLIQMLKDLDIGRPSTYVAIITTILSRNYVKREGKAFVPTPLGEVTNKLMLENFSSIVDYGFTADMENDLDEIENGEENMLNVLNRFWKDFSVQLETAEKTIGANTIEVPPEETDLLCDKCGSRMVVRNGRFGKFAACPNYPNCRSTKPLTAPAAEENAEDEEQAEKKAPVIADFKCEKCGGDMVLRTGKFGSFYACANYPECKFTKARVRETGVDCPKCGAKVITKFGRSHTVFYSCEKYPECDFSSWDLPTSEKCPTCGKMLFRKKGKNLLICQDKSCGFSKEIAESASSEDKRTNE